MREWSEPAVPERGALGVPDENDMSGVMESRVLVGRMTKVFKVAMSASRPVGGISIARLEHFRRSDRTCFLLCGVDVYVCVYGDIGGGGEGGGKGVVFECVSVTAGLFEHHPRQYNPSSSTNPKPPKTGWQIKMRGG